jgi:ABC-type Fe3+-citrate transport system substrate-binding protein
MTRNLILVIIVMALGFVLVSPYVDADDAVHHRANHHDLGWSTLQARPALIVISDNSFLSANEAPSSLTLQPTILALRC